MKLKTTIRESIVALLAPVLIVGVAYATTGSFTAPTGTTPTNTYRTLGDIYAKLINFNLNPTATHSISTTTSPAGSMYTLGDIYGLLTAENARLIPNNIRNNVTIFGVRGTMVEGTGSTHTLDWTRTFPTLTTVNGVEVWQAGMVHGGLCWDTQSYMMMDACATRLTTRWPGDIIGGFYEANPNVGPNGENSIPLGVVEYCDYLNQDGTTVATTPQHYWRLPTQEELYFKATQAIFNGEDDQISQSRGGFRKLINGAYPSSEFSDANYFQGTPLGMHDSVKVVGFVYSPSTNQVASAPGTQTKKTRFGFRCVHQN